MGINIIFLKIKNYLLRIYENIYTKKWLKNFNLYSSGDDKDLLSDDNLIQPIVDLSSSRNIALERFSRIK